jgi:dihydrofolate reductase
VLLAAIEGALILARARRSTEPLNTVERYFATRPPKRAKRQATGMSGRASALAAQRTREGTEALLLGRRSYEFLAALWPSRSGELADRLNSLPKYVVSSTLEDPEWNNSTVLKGEVVNEVSKLKHELNGEINVIASFQLGRTLIEHDLLDELRLMVFPVVLGAGERLFGETSDKKSVRLLDTRTVGDGVAYLTYELVREA